MASERFALARQRARGKAGWCCGASTVIQMWPLCWSLLIHEFLFGSFWHFVWPFQTVQHSMLEYCKRSKLTNLRWNTSLRFNQCMKTLSHKVASEERHSTPKEPIPFRFDLQFWMNWPDSKCLLFSLDHALHYHERTQSRRLHCWIRTLEYCNKRSWRDTRRSTVLWCFVMLHTMY